jgi:energy-coupling factor transporter ATP-binding protein EcfA2
VLEIAAAGAHSILFAGPPGSGKSMLATRLPGLLPPMTRGGGARIGGGAVARRAVPAREDSSVHPYRTHRTTPPLRPHSSAAAACRVRAKSRSRTRAFCFSTSCPSSIAACSKPCANRWKAGRIHISRAARQADFPAQFQLIAAMNPCPCGHHGGTERQRAIAAAAPPDQVARYRSKLSGPLLDRIDLQIEVPALPAEALQQAPPRASRRPPSAQRVSARARAPASTRQNKPNAGLTTKEIDAHCQPYGGRRRAAEKRRHPPQPLGARDITACSRWRARSPIWRRATPFFRPSMLPRRSSTAVSPRTDLQPTRTLSPRGMTILLAGLSALGPFSIDTYLPSFHDIGASSTRRRCRCSRRSPRTCSRSPSCRSGTAQSPMRSDGAA